MPSLSNLIPKNIILPDDIYIHIMKLYFTKYVIPECLEYTEYLGDRIDVYRNEYEWPSTYSCSSKILNNMYNVITEEKLWPFFAKEEPPYHFGYSFWDEIRIMRISQHPTIMRDLHSSSSLNWCFRIMQYIAINGWNSILKKN